MIIVRYHALLRERTNRTEEIYPLPTPPLVTLTLNDVLTTLGFQNAADKLILTSTMYSAKPEVSTLALVPEP